MDGNDPVSKIVNSDLPVAEKIARLRLHDATTANYLKQGEILNVPYHEALQLLVVALVGEKHRAAYTIKSLHDRSVNPTAIVKGAFSE